MNSDPRPGPSLRASICPSCSSTSRRTTVRPIPRPPWAGEPRVACEKRSKIRGQQLGRYAEPVVADAEDGLVARMLDLDVDPPSRRRVLRGVGQQVLDDLLEPRRIRVDGAFAGGDQRQRVAAPVDERSRALDGARRRVARGDTALASQADLSLGDPGHVEEVVDQSRQVLGLPARDLECAFPGVTDRGGRT